jgi:DNA-binding CsgD family transcriptional regulator
MKELRVTELTPQQCAILNEVARGHENKVIAGDLGLSQETVKTQLRRAFAKLGVASRDDAARRHHRLKTWKGHVCGKPNGPLADDLEPVPDLSPDDDDGG